MLLGKPKGGALGMTQDASGIMNSTQTFARAEENASAVSPAECQMLRKLLAIGIAVVERRKTLPALLQQ